MPDAAPTRDEAGASQEARRPSLPVWPIGIFVAFLRIGRGWSRTELARAAGVPSSYLSEYENGKKTPELRTLNRLVEAMGYSPSALDRARRFLDDLRADGVSADFEAQARARTGWATALADDGRNPGADLAWELERVTDEAGRLLTRLLRAALLFSSQPRAKAGADAGDQESGTGLGDSR